MKKIGKNSKKIFFHIAALFLLAPFYAAKAEYGGAGTGGKFSNPLGTTSISCLAYKITEIAFELIFLVAVMFIIFSGLKFVTARGNEQQLEKARKIFVWAVLGAALVLGASVIIRVAISTLESFGVSGVNFTGC